MNWTYNQKPVENISDFPNLTYGFVYKITHKETGKSYIGKKILQFTRKVKLGKKELKLLEGGKGRRQVFKVVVKESDWASYWGSNKYLKDLYQTEPKENFERDILIAASSKKQLTYYEVKYQMIYQVLEKPEEFFNDNILGKFYTKDFI
tara:strand:- start:1139 stop:1585 length:447 start_codon:yes stop_codon:yes gene_type:complete